ncbi:MAG: class I SAM-dependent methyltransferase [Flavobacteriia bacterium]|nr:class I SAM-dependent methyltransferase [Flavobacteriia bacterium]
MNFLDEKLENYTQTHSDIEPELLKKINRETNLHVLKPRMLSGHFQGRLLSMISKMCSPKNILEIGTYTGYSALCLAEGLQKEGQITTIDNNKELESRVRSYFNESEYSKKINYIVEDALITLNKIDLSIFNLVFIDADKTNYLNYYQILMDQLQTGAIILADNVLWSGKVLDNIKENDEETRNLRAYNETIQNDDRVENILLPIRDGIMLCRVK